ncbi:MAG: cupin [SAR86 cluster bacterium]|uniref:Cupin n=1 Tax=SAR86 cluster bacterium TaxID=2030880 RepID=A0A2A5B3M3_9GAMM|nr:MAG: cupin [SAR86 cluster bacterium]
MSTLQLNTLFSSEDFLKNYWQQKPVLLSELIPDFKDPVTPEELAGLACEELSESRLIKQLDSGSNELSHGPFAEQDFTCLPQTNWTLLVQAVDQWVEDVADVKRLFDFIPSWRVDDVMVSFAATGGGVGPHFDYYDVFLLQGQGQRHWKVGERCSSNVQLQPNSELGILENFEQVTEYTLSAGDALYIPPRFAHWGVAQSDSLCYSIGFRAPSVAEMIEGFSDFLMKEQDPAQRFEDTYCASKVLPGEIGLGQLDASFQNLLSRFSDKSNFSHWFGCYVTQPKYPELIQPAEAPLNAGQSISEFTLIKNPSSRFAFIESKPESCILLFVDGNMARFDMENLKAISQLCDVTSLNSETINALLKYKGMEELLRLLVNQGSLQLI